MSEGMFKKGYVDGWRWIRGTEEPTCVPSHPEERELGDPYLASLTRAIRDAGAARTPPESEEEAVESWLRRALRFATRR
jgi:hypothetical protein